jgi:hypothetical protein
MNARFAFYPFDCVDPISQMSRHHWIIRGYLLPPRRPTRAELPMVNPPSGLLYDEDYEEEMQLAELLRKRQARRAAQAGIPIIRVPCKHPSYTLLDQPRPSTGSDFIFTLFSSASVVVPGVRKNAEPPHYPSAGPAPPEHDPAIGPASTNDNARIGQPSSLVALRWKGC